MPVTIFDTPLLTPVLRLLARGGLRLTRWHVKLGTIGRPRAPCVLIGAPHTSNWDCFYMLLVILALGIKVRWFGKHTLFRFPFAGIMRWLGGIPVDRTRSANVVSQVADQFLHNPDLILIIPPEGTRKKVERWKTGFYHIARLAGVPVILAAIDGEKREMRLLGTVVAEEDDPEQVEAVIEDIRSRFYAGIIGICPENT